MKLRTRKRCIYTRRVVVQGPLTVEDRKWCEVQRICKKFGSPDYDNIATQAMFENQPDLMELNRIIFESERDRLGVSTQNNGARPAVTSAEFMEHLRHQAAAQLELDILAERLLPEKEICKRLRLTAEALSAAVNARRIFALKGSSGEFYYPAFFADKRKSNRRALKKVCEVLGDIPAGIKWDFFTARQIPLGCKNPVQAIARGKVRVVISAARSFLEE